MAVMGGNIGFDEGGVAQGIAAILEALNKEGITRTVTNEKVYKSGRKKVTEDVIHVSLLTPGAILLIWLLFQLYEKAGGLATEFGDWLNERVKGGYYAQGWDALQMTAFAWRNPELYGQYMGDPKYVAPSTTWVQEEPATEWYDPETGTGGGTFGWGGTRLKEPDPMEEDHTPDSFWNPRKDMA